MMALPIAGTACCFGGSSHSESAHKDTSSPAAPAQPAAQPATATPEPAARANDGLPADIPSSRSAVPTLPEWNSVTREITVRKSTPLGCETKMLREWLRVSCRGKTSTGATPTDVKKGAGCGGDTYVFASNGVTSVVTPVLRGKSCNVAFSWSQGEHDLVVNWANGAPRPTIAFQD